MTLGRDIEALAAAVDTSGEVVERVLCGLVLDIYGGLPLSGTFLDRLEGAPPAREFPSEMTRTAIHLARQLAARPAARLDELELVDDGERTVLLGQFSEAPGGGDTINELFAECVRSFPEQRAVTDREHSLTYAELDRRVDVSAGRLLREGVQPQEPVAILLEPSLDMIVAMLAVLRAGACYLPIDTELPIDRVRYLLDDSGARFLIARKTPSGDSVRSIDPGELLEGAGEVLFPRVREDQSAYLIYTSGTTGKPKGVLIEHGSLVNYVTWFRRRYGVDRSTTAALLTSYAYDLGYTTLWTTILSGGHLHLLPKFAAQDPGSLVRYFRDHRVTFIKVTPSLLGALLTSSELNRENCGALRLLVTGGENVRPRDLETIAARCPDVLVVNHYGPTETTIGATTHPIENAKLAEFVARPVIGSPIANVRAYVTTPSLQLLPIGARGELLIGGRGVARGYHQRDELTREKFIADPFAGSGRVYRSGDLARWTAEHTLEFLGRVDRQVKIRGYRVELAEIEHLMRRRLPIEEVIVQERALGPTNRALCAYYRSEKELAAQDLRASLSQVLPDYMVPAYFTRVLSFPRTPNGKLDLESLPEPRLDPPDRALDRPRNETERVLAKIWSATLGVAPEALGVSQNFFELGGHSLLMIQILAEIEEHFGRTIELPIFYNEGTIRALAEALDGAA